MSQVTLLDGKKKATLPSEYFDAQTNVALIHQVVVAQLAAARQGTHSTKTRGEVSGGGAKPWRQKGTGRARQGSRRAPQWTGGGTVHGPKPRNYAQRTPKKMVAAALRGALSDRARDGKVHVIGSIVSGETPSTKAALKALAKVAESNVLVVLDRADDVSWLSLRNVPNIHALAVDQLNAYDVLANDEVVFTAAALADFVGGEPVGEEAPQAEDDADAAKTADEAAVAVADAAGADAVEAKPKKRAAKPAKSEA
ncbi:MAG: 50S ribosomal protein L4, partial [Propionibacteriaceae bacterium]|nr:50S ribosomal protein L4 [Propionibacteriaceae bacterium]